MQRWTDAFSVGELVRVARETGLGSRLKYWYWDLDIDEHPSPGGMPSQKLRFCRVLGLYLWHLTEEGYDNFRGSFAALGLKVIPYRRLPLHLRDFIDRFEPCEVGTIADHGSFYNGPYTPRPRTIPRAALEVIEGGKK